jgi:hypothetical protein
VVLSIVVSRRSQVTRVHPLHSTPDSNKQIEAEH